MGSTKSYAMKFFLSPSCPPLTITWNDASPTEWYAIRKFFIGAYVNAYAYLYKDGIKDHDPLELDQKWKCRAQRFLFESVSKARVGGIPVLLDEIFKPLQYFYTLDFQTEIDTLSDYVTRNLTGETPTLIYLQHLLALIYFFEDCYQCEKTAIEEQTLKRPYSIQYIIARLHDRPIGFISCNQNYKSGHVYLRWVNLANGFQGKGLGRRMLEEITKHFSETIGIELYTRCSNKGAMRFYSSCGLQPVNNISGSLRAKDWLMRPGLYPPDDDLISAHHETYIGFHGRLTTRPVTIMEL